MGKKIFVSYKYADDQVESFRWDINTTVHDYVEKLIEKVGVYDDIYKGEKNGEDLSRMSDDTIWNKLRDRIYDSSVTIVFISPGMREQGKKDRDQWIPWEISYSLKETARRNRKGQAITSHSNAMLAVVLPDVNGSYSYYLESRTCCANKCTTHHTNRLFEIIKNNKFNKNKNESKRICSNNEAVWTGACSYIEAVKWSDFIVDYQRYVDNAVERQSHIDEYDIEKEI